MDEASRNRPVDNIAGAPPSIGWGIRLEADQRQSRTLKASAPGRTSGSLVRQAYEAIREDIITGRVIPGHPLRMDAVGRRLGISVIPVREAIRLLEAEGMVIVIRNRGAFVTDQSIEDMRDLILARSVVEPELARLAAMNRDNSFVADARRLVNRMVAGADHRTNSVTNTMHNSLHTLIEQHSKAVWLARLSQQLRGAADRYAYWAALRTPGELRTDHEDIVEAIVEKDPTAAARATTNHLLRMSRALEAALTHRRESNTDTDGP